ncbi:sulfotransferase domain-containing protein [Algiphilus sp.]|uniref:sulfotransferase domain-containing protein n=1 Tax=Algiphilus sp. TaxID=1872431 RepID=UPI003B51A58F
MLVSYPKSGNTWVRALVSHLVNPQSSLSEMEQLVPDVYKSRGRELKKAYRFPCGGRLIKSHQSFRPDYKRVIYITRDPRDVCVSYYHYLRGVRSDSMVSEMSLDGFVSLFLSGGLDGYGTWAEHVGSWECAESADMLRLTYEELKSEPMNGLMRICEFLGICCGDEAVYSAVRACSMEKLREREDREGSQWSARRTSAPGARFFRSGTSRNFSELSPLMQEKICRRWHEQMLRFGYD